MENTRKLSAFYGSAIVNLNTQDNAEEQCKEFLDLTVEKLCETVCYYVIEMYSIKEGDVETLEKRLSTTTMREVIDSLIGLDKNEEAK